MSFIPEDELRGVKAQSLAPMIDFLFLMLMFFATLAVSRVTTRDTNIDLVEVKPETSAEIQVAEYDKKTINISITKEGDYKWITELKDYAISTPDAVAAELHRQHEAGILPKDHSKTQVLLRIDKAAPWDPILRLVFAVRGAGFAVHPIYIPDEEVAEDENKEKTLVRTL